MVTREPLLAITLTLIMVTAAGCAGWGTDSPADDQDQDQGNGDDLEGADGEAQAGEGNGSDGSSSDANESDSSRDSSSSDTGTDSGDTKANTDTTDGSSDTASGGEDESTDETGSTGDGDSDSSTDTDDSDSDSDSATGDGDTNQDEYKDTVEETERTLKVTVVDEDGNPIEGASVHATGPVLSNGVAHEPAGETNADGVATLTAYDGEYGVEAQHDGTTTDKKAVVVDGDTEVTITIDTSPDEDPGEETHTLTATVLNPDDEPVEGLPVDLTAYDEGEPVATATTDENGQVTFEVEPGDYELVPDVSDSEYTNYGTHPVAVTEDTEYTMKLVSPPDDGNGDGDTGDDDAPYGTLTVTVEDSDGETVEGVEVVGIGPEGEIRSATTDANGQATFDLSDGKYTFSVSTDGTEYADSSEQEITMDGSDQSITLTVQADDGDETNTLTVNLANDDVDGVGIEVWRAVSGDEDSNRVTKESENGQATFELEPGHYHADAEGYLGTLSPINLTDGDVEITLQNRSGATVPVEVTDAETGEPIEGAKIGHDRNECHLNYSTGEADISGTTGEDGVAQAHAGVTPAWCQDTLIEADGYEDQRVDIHVPVDEPVTVELTPTEKNDDGGEEQHQLTVNALDQENDPLPNATVNVVEYDGGADVGSATTNGDGVATFDVEDGEYEVSVSHDDYQTDGIDGPVNVRGEDATVDVSMPEAPGEKNRLTVNLANDDIDGVAVTAEREGPDVDPDPVTKASAGGQVTFRLDPGYYYVSANEYNDTQVAIDVTEDNEITLQKTDAQPVTFTVTDAETSDPIEGAEVSGECNLWYSSGDVYIEGDGTTNENGVVEAMPGVTPTDCNPVRVTAEGYEPTDASVSVPADQTVTVELTPKQDSGEEQYQLSVNALDHEGNPLPNATVNVVT